MTHNERVAAIEYACQAIQAGDRVFNTLAEVVGCDPESALWSSFHTLQDVIIKQAAQLIGDTAGWLSWYAFENDFGRNGMTAKAAKWQKMRPIKTASQLATLIEADL